MKLEGTITGILVYVWSQVRQKYVALHVCLEHQNEDYVHIRYIYILKTEHSVCRLLAFKFSTQIRVENENTCQTFKFATKTSCLQNSKLVINTPFVPPVD